MSLSEGIDTEQIHESDDGNKCGFVITMRARVRFKGIRAAITRHEVNENHLSIYKKTGLNESKQREHNGRHPGANLLWYHYITNNIHLLYKVPQCSRKRDCEC